MPRLFRFGTYMFQCPAGGIWYGQAPLNWRLPAAAGAAGAAGFAASAGFGASVGLAAAGAGAAAAAGVVGGAGAVGLVGSAAGLAGAAVGAGAAWHAARTPAPALAPMSASSWRRLNARRLRWGMVSPSLAVRHRSERRTSSVTPARKINPIAR